MKRLSRFQADLILLLVAVLWGTTFVTSKLALNTLSPIAIIALRFILALALMVILFRKELKHITKSDLIGGGIVGLMLFTAFFTQLFALKFTDPGKQAFLAGTYVVFVPFILWALTKVRPSGRSFIGVLLTFIGIALLSLNGSQTLSFGDSITLLSSVFFAGHIIATSYFVKKSTPIRITVVQFATVALLASVITIFTDSIPKTMDLNVAVSILYLGIVCTGIAYFLQTYGQKYGKTTHTAIILSLESVFGSLLSMIVLHEVFTLKMVMGSALILIAILVTELKKEEESV